MLTLVKTSIEYKVLATPFDFFLPRLAHFAVYTFDHRISGSSRDDLRTFFVMYSCRSLYGRPFTYLANRSVYDNIGGLQRPLYLLRAIIVHKSPWLVYLRRRLPTFLAHCPLIHLTLGRSIYLWQGSTNVPLSFPIFLVIKVINSFELHYAVMYYEGIVLRYIILAVLIIELVHRTFLQEWVQVFCTNFGHLPSVHGSIKLLLTFSHTLADFQVVIHLICL